LFVVFAGRKQPKQVGKMPGFRKIYDHTFFEKFVEVNKLCLGLGIVDEVSVSKVTVSIDYITV